MQRRMVSLLCGVGLAMSVAGCGQSAPPADGASDPPTSLLPTASIGGPKVTAEAGPEPGTPAWSLLEIQKIRMQPLLRAAKKEGEAGTKNPKEGPSEETNADVDVAKIAAVRAERNEKIVALATAVIAATHQDPAQEEAFVAGVHQLMEARLQLAMQGSRDEVDALYADSESLLKKYPKSKAAAEAAYARVRFAHMNAQRSAGDEPRWLQEFARQARLFATEFPAEETRAPMLLQSAAWSCELYDMQEESIGCYSTLEQQFPKHPLAKQAAASLRRLNLKGRPVELAGPTLDGGFTRIDDFAGKTVLVCFWASDSEVFLEILPRLQAVLTKYEKQGLTMVGVNLDEDESDVTKFLEQHPLPYPHIFHPDPAQRRWENPVVKYYGVRDIPALWLVNSDGVVVDTFFEIEQLDEIIKKLIGRGSQASAASGRDR